MPNNLALLLISACNTSFKRVINLKPVQPSYQGWITKRTANYQLPEPVIGHMQSMPQHHLVSYQFYSFFIFIEWVICSQSCHPYLANVDIFVADRYFGNQYYFQGKALYPFQIQSPFPTRFITSGIIMAFFPVDMLRDRTAARMECVVSLFSLTSLAAIVVACS